MSQVDFTLADGSIIIKAGDEEWLNGAQATIISANSDIQGTGGSLSVYVIPARDYIGDDDYSTVTIEDAGAPANVLDGTKIGPATAEGEGEIVSFGGEAYGIKIVDNSMTGPTVVQLNIAQRQNT